MRAAKHRISILQAIFRAVNPIMLPRIRDQLKALEVKVQVDMKRDKLQHIRTFRLTRPVPDHAIDHLLVLIQEEGRRIRPAEIHIPILWTVMDARVLERHPEVHLVRLDEVLRRKGRHTAEMRRLHGHVRRETTFPQYIRKEELVLRAGVTAQDEFLDLIFRVQKIQRQIDAGFGRYLQVEASVGTLNEGIRHGQLGSARWKNRSVHLGPTRRKTQNKI